MLDIIIYTIFGLFSGVCLGTTSINPIGIILLILNALGIGDYKSNLGATMILNIFPITIGSVFEFYKSGQINWLLAWVLIFSVTIGSYLGSILVTNKKNALSVKTIQYLTAYISIVMGILFLISAYYSKDE